MATSDETCQETPLILITNTVSFLDRYHKITTKIEIPSTQEELRQKNFNGYSGHLNKRFKNIEISELERFWFWQILFDKWKKVTLLFRKYGEFCLSVNYSVMLVAFTAGTLFLLQQNANLGILQQLIFKCCLESSRSEQQYECSQRDALRTLWQKASLRRQILPHLLFPMFEKLSNLIVLVSLRSRKRLFDLLFLLTTKKSNRWVVRVHFLLGGALKEKDRTTFFDLSSSPFEKILNTFSKWENFKIRLEDY